MSYPNGAFNASTDSAFQSEFSSPASPFDNGTSYSSYSHVASDFFPPYQTFIPSVNKSQPAPPAHTTHMNNKALISMLLGIISFVTFWPAIPAIILGFIARKEIKRGKGTGKLMAFIGVICGLIGCVSSFAFWLLLGLFMIPLFLLPFIAVAWFFLKA